MTSDWSAPRTARDVIALGHVVVGVAALVFAGVLVVASRQPTAYMDALLLAPGLLLALVGLLFTTVAVTVLRNPGDQRARTRSLVLSVTELAVGLSLTSAAVVASVQGYGGFEPWRSPLLLPAAALVSLGLWGFASEVARKARSTRDPAQRHTS